MVTAVAWSCRSLTSISVWLVRPSEARTKDFCFIEVLYVRKEEVKYLLGTRTRFRRLYTCFKEGHRTLANFGPNPKRTPKALTRCGCSACLEIELSAATGEWFVKKFEDKHNHTLAKEGESAYLYSHRKMTDGQKADIVRYGIGGLRTDKIMDVMEYQAGGPDKKDKDADFFHRYNSDKDGHLRNLFWADGQSWLDYDAFGGVLIFDSTYRVNRYNLPFVPFVGVNHHRSTTVFGFAVLSDETTKTYIWLLETFLMAMHQKHPKSLISDGDYAMARVIYVVIPEAFHRLSSWHIEQNMIRHIRKEKLKEFRKLVYLRMEVDEFEEIWDEFREQYGFSENVSRFSSMYELKEKWSVAYTKGGYFLGMRRNQRSESLNSGLHNHLNRKMSLVDLLEHSQYYHSRLRRNKAELDAKASQPVPFTKISDHPLLKSAARIYTPAMFKMVKARDYGEHDVTCVNSGTTLESVNCHCRKMQREDIPCAQVFRVLTQLGISNMPHCCVAVRWTMQGKDIFEPERQ
uniref:Uncharacterized protein n=1 Tax=Avena sativa TaxID=4498 RepID=A0ACD5VCT8_AVESA